MLTEKDNTSKSLANKKIFFAIKVLMFFIVLTELYSILFDYRQFKVNIIEGYTDAGSYFSEDTVDIFLNFEKSCKGVSVCVYNTKNVAVDSFLCNANTNENLNGEKWKSGAQLNKVEYSNSQLSPGFYMVDNRISLIVKSEIVKDKIVIVVPYINAHVGNNYGGKSFFDYNSSNYLGSDTVSLNRPFKLDKYSSFFIPFIDSILTPNICYISDIDLENYNQIKGAKLLLFYGEMSYFTSLMRENVSRFIGDGGNVLVLTAKYLNDNISINHSAKQIIKKRADEDEDYYNYKTAGSTYRSNFLTDKYPITSNGFKIVDPSSFLFSGFEKQDSIIEFEFSLVSSPVLSFSEKHFWVDTIPLGYYHQKVMAIGQGNYNNGFNIGAIYVFRPTPNSGTVINIGILEFASKEFMERKQNLLLLKNALLKLSS